MIKKGISVYIIAYFCISCASKRNIIGHYANDIEKFTFGKDSVFTYKYSAFHSSENSKGAYKYFNDRFYLNSYSQERGLVMSVQEVTNEEQNDALTIFIHGKLPPENYKVQIFINDTLHALANDAFLVSTGLNYEEARKEINIADLYFRFIRGDSLMNLKFAFPINSLFLRILKYPLASTEVAMYQIQSDKYISATKSNKALFISASLNDSMFNYKTFVNEAIRVKENGIKVKNYNNKWYFIPKVSLD
jgi:hypothetical protein